eukprot:scaffold1034_cov175-Ochromonas_danica.AAC.15
MQLMRCLLLVRAWSFIFITTAAARESEHTGIGMGIVSFLTRYDTNREWSDPKAQTATLTAALPPPRLVVDRKKHHKIKERLSYNT